MSDDEFTKLFKYIEEMRNEMRKGFEDATKDRSDIRGAVADLAGLIKDYHQEMILLARKVDRMERWIHEIAKQTGVKLSEV